LGLLLPLLGRQEPPIFAVNLNFLPPPLSRPNPVGRPNPESGPELPYGVAKSRADQWWLGDASLAYRPRIHNGELAGEIEGDGHLFPPTAVAEYGERFCALLEAVAEDPDLPVHTLTAGALR
jgi:hypothetical protein